MREPVLLFYTDDYLYVLNQDAVAGWLEPLTMEETIAVLRQQWSRSHHPERG